MNLKKQFITTFFFFSFAFLFSQNPSDFTLEGIPSIGTDELNFDFNDGGETIQKRSNYNEANEAKTLTSKYGESFLPKKGELSLSFDITPLIIALGGNRTTSTSGFNESLGESVSNTGFVLKYFLQDQLALKGNFSMNIINTENKAADPNSQTSYEKESMNSYRFGLGVEKRFGKTRVQGYAGGGLVFGIFNSTQTPVDLDASKMNSNFFGVRGFLGAEYFFAPKWALNFEYGLGVYLLNSKSSSDEGKKEFFFGVDNNGFASPNRDSFTSNAYAITKDLQGLRIGITFHF